MYYNESYFRENKVDLWANSGMRGPMRQNTVGCIPSLAGLRPISMEESSVSNLVLSTGSNHYVIHVPAHPIHVTRTCNKPSFQTILLQGIFGYQFEGSPGEFDQTKYVIGGRNRKTPSNLKQQGQTQGTETEREARQPQGTFALIFLFREMGLRISWVCFYRGNVQEIRFL